MSVSIMLDQPLDPLDTYKLAETTDLLYRKLRNVRYARRHADFLLADDHTALQLAAAKVIKKSQIGTHPVHAVNSGNLVVLRAVTLSAKRVILLGVEGRVYAATRGHLFPDGKFIPTAESLRPGFMLFKCRRERRLTRIATLRPTKEYIN